MSFMPCWRYAMRSWSSMFPVMAMIGVWLSKFLMMEVAVAPSRLGMTMSMRTRSNRCFSSVEIAERPSVTTSTVHPYLRRNFEHSLMEIASSSTRSTWNPLRRALLPLLPLLPPERDPLPLLFAGLSSGIPTRPSSSWFPSNMFVLDRMLAVLILARSAVPSSGPSGMFTGL